MKHYYIKRGNFGNVYSLAYTVSAEQSATAEARGYERITYREARRLCAAENRRRKYDSAFSGFADNLIYPINWSDDHYPRIIDGYIVID